MIDSFMLKSTGFRLIMDTHVRLWLIDCFSKVLEERISSLDMGWVPKAGFPGTMRRRIPAKLVLASLHPDY